MALSRRFFLKSGLAGGALLSVGGVGLALQSTVPGPVPAGLHVLDGATWSVVAAVARCMCPPDGPSADALDIASRVDAQLAVMHEADAAEVIQGLYLLENGLAGILLGGGPRTFTASDSSAQSARLRAWQHSSITVVRKAYKAIRGLVITAYYSHPKSYAFTGFPGPPDFGQGSAPAIQLAQVTEPLGKAPDRPVDSGSPEPTPSSPAGDAG